MSIPGSLIPLFSTGSSAAVGYQIERSLRFNSSDSAYLSRTPAVAGNRTTWTWAGWVKKGGLTGVTGHLWLMGGGTSGSNSDDIYFNAGNSTVDDRFVFASYYGSSQFTLELTRKFRDPSAWYHIVIAVNTTIASPSSDRVKIYVNGEVQTDFATANYPSQNFQFSYFNNTSQHLIGSSRFGSPGNYFSGYLADIHFIDDQQLTPSSFTEVSATTGQLIPKAYSGSFGTNGFWLKFSDNSAATAAALGNDYSGNNNDWTPVNLQVASGPIYSNFATATPGWYSSTSEIANALNLFDASTVTRVLAGSLNSTNGTFEWYYSAGIPFASLLRLYFSTAGYGQSFSVDTGAGYVNIGVPSSGWNTIVTGSGTLKGIKSTTPGDAGGNNWTSINAIELDSSILVQPDPAGNDSLVDTPTSYGTDTSGVGGEVRGNYATLNPLNNPGGSTLSNGNLDCVTSSSLNGRVVGTIAVTSGKWYWEMLATNTATDLMVGISAASETTATTNPASATTYLYDSYLGDKWNNGSHSAYAATYTTNDVIGVALNLDAGTLVFYKNGTSLGTAFSSLSGTFVPAFADGGTGTSSFTANFGQRAFAYTAPSGFKALCDTNLGPPLVALPNKNFDIITYPGNGSTQTIPNATSTPATALDFGGVGQIGFSWIKQRSDPSTSHAIYDARRGVQARLESDTTDQEATSDNGVTAFNAGTIALGSQAQANSSSETYVAWCWATAAQDSSSHTQGSITSQVRANASAGFSVVTYSGNGSAGSTVGHGLNVAPSFLICKRRNTTENWSVYHKSLAAGYWLTLNGTGAASNASNHWTTTAPTSSVFYLGDDGPTNSNIGTYVCYAFAPVVGYSSFGSYVGTFTNPGPFVYTGFRPAFVLLKNSSLAGSSWIIYDNKRNGLNETEQVLNPNSSGIEATYASTGIDFLSNGFKIRGDSSWHGQSGEIVIYAAFAENPFQYARAR